MIVSEKRKNAGEEEVHFFIFVSKFEDFPFCIVQNKHLIQSSFWKENEALCQKRFTKNKRSSYHCFEWIGVYTSQRFTEKSNLMKEDDLFVSTLKIL